MKRVMMVLAVVALIAVVAFPAMAYRRMAWGGGGCFNGGAGGYGMMDPARNLDLTADQLQKINAVREAFIKEANPIRDQLYAKNGELRTLWLAKTPDQEKILSLQREVRGLRDQLADKAAANQLEIRKILTPEQLAKGQPYNGIGRGCRMARGGAGMWGGGFTPGW